MRLPALNDGAGRERLFVVDGPDRQDELRLRQGLPGSSDPRRIVTFRGCQFVGETGGRRYCLRGRG
jgi:hypothetical protein